VARFLVAGALDLSQKNSQELVRCLGEEIIDQGHDLLNGCRNEFDKLVAQSAFERLIEKGLEPGKRIVSYAVAGCQPIHEFGTILKSRLPNWELTFKRLYVPEPVQQADAVIVVGGAEGTMCAANWARIDEKPLLPITAFGGAAAEIYNEELKEFESNYADRVERFQYETLNQMSSDWRKIAKDTVSLAARLISSRQVVAVMSFSRDPKLEDAYESFQEICREHQYECSRVDNTNSVGRIVPEIYARIKKAAFVIADLTEERPNIYYELGLAQGLNKPVVVTAFKGTILPFDVADIPTIFWEGQKQLKDKLRERVALIASSQGR
jgi:hypothetical protein